MKSSKVVFYLWIAGILLSGCSAIQAQAAIPAAAATETPVPAAVTMEYIGHACFLLTASDGTRIVIDPYQDYTVPREIQMFPKGITADAVVLTHFHPDHTNWKAIGGARLISEPGTDSVGMVKLTGFKADHGIFNGAPAGLNTVWVLEIGGIKIVHPGGSAVITQPEILKAIEGADVVIFRASGDGAHPSLEMLKQMRELNTRTLIPTHYSISAEYRYTTQTLEEFLALLGPDETVVRDGTSTLEVTDGMPTQIVALEPSALKSQ
jgi:L-ascorbate metabolism protein UlaG (beta-lactamase superfamily)